MNVKQPADTVSPASGSRQPGAPALVVTAQSVQLCRRLGPLAWMALQYLAVSSHRVDRGWAAAAGVRHVATGIGVTKDTAARAISRLVTAGLVTRDRVDVPGGRRRSGYLLHLPEEIRLIDRPTDLDTIDDRRSARPDQEDSSRLPSGPECPHGEYSSRPPVGPDCPKGNTPPAT